MKKSTIEWTETTWNPTTGCTEISKECDNCYARIRTESLQKDGMYKYRAGFDEFMQHSYTLKEPSRWTKPTLAFVNSMSDLFHKDMKLEFLQQIFEVMNVHPMHTFQVLTKRDAILLELSPALTWTENIWMGVSVGSCASIRKIDRLRKCGAKNKFLSVEPLIEELPDLNLEGIDWVIVGGESGKGLGIRPIKKEWILKIKKNCEEQNVPFFFKQWGKNEFNPDPHDPTIIFGHPDYAKGGCQIDGKMYRENPCIVDPHFGELPFEW